MDKPMELPESTYAGGFPVSLSTRPTQLIFWLELPRVEFGKVMTREPVGHLAATLHRPWRLVPLSSIHVTRHMYIVAREKAIGGHGWVPVFYTQPMAVLTGTYCVRIPLSAKAFMIWLLIRRIACI
jgi:hypothetical protein